MAIHTEELPKDVVIMVDGVAYVGVEKNESSNLHQGKQRRTS